MKTVVAMSLPVVVLLAFWFVYSPEHWLSNMGTVSATVDGHPAEAELFLGNPTHSEAEAIALFRVREGGAYLVSFDDEKYREASDSEFMRIHWGVWTYKSMRSGEFSPPLPSHGNNEFRVASSKGQLVIVRF